MLYVDFSCALLTTEQYLFQADKVRELVGDMGIEYGMVWFDCEFVVE